METMICNEEAFGKYCDVKSIRRQKTDILGRMKDVTGKHLEIFTNSSGNTYSYALFLSKDYNKKN